MDKELIQVTEYGAELERTWTQTSSLLPSGVLTSTTECRCPCTDSCNKVGKDIGICFPGY